MSASGAVSAGTPLSLVEQLEPQELGGLLQDRVTAEGQLRFPST